MKAKGWRIVLLMLALLLGMASIPVRAASTLCSCAAEIGNISRYSDVEDSPLYKRNVLFFGDSLCNARGERESGRVDAGYAGRIGERFHMNWINYGASGYALSSAKGQGSMILSKIKSARWDTKVAVEEPVSYDLIVLQGGVNDAWVNAPLGEMEEGFLSSDFDQSTFAGGLEYTLSYVKKQFPEASVCYIIMYQMPLGALNGQPVWGVRDQSAYISLQKQILEKWEIPYLDLYHDTEFNDSIFKVTTTQYLSGDYVHMKSNGYDLLASYLIPWLESLELPARSAEEEPDTDDESESESETQTETQTENQTEAERQEDGEANGAPADGSEPQERAPLWLWISLAGGGTLLVGGAASLILIICLKKRGKR